MFKYKKDTYFFLEDTDENERLCLPKYCEWHNCEKKGEYRAPSSRENLREFKWFCLEHVKLYNKAWDYFKGKTSDEIYREISKDAVWHRRTSKRLKNFKIADSYNFINKDSKSYKRKILFPNDDNGISNALSILDMQMPNSMETLKKRYKKLVKKFHPDINKEKDIEYIVKLNEAYSTLLKLFKF